MGEIVKFPERRKTCISFRENGEMIDEKINSIGINCSHGFVVYYDNEKREHGFFFLEKNEKLLREDLERLYGLAYHVAKKIRRLHRITKE